MTAQRLAAWLKAGYPHVKAGSGLPPWLLPERSLNRTTDEVGDDGLLSMGRPLGMAEAAERLADNAPGPAAMSAEAWQQAIAGWPHLPRVRPVFEAFIEVSGGVMEHLRKTGPGMDPAVICRGMAVLLFAPLVGEGRWVLEEIAGALGGDAGRPEQLVRAYADAVLREDILTLESVNRCMLRDRAWSEWAAAVEEQVLSCRCTPRLIGVTPPLSPDLAAVLASMIEEGRDGPGGDHPGYPGSEMPAQ
jgi:hypothetical protein